MNWGILEVSLGINNVLCNDKRDIRGLGFPFSYSSRKLGIYFYSLNYLCSQYCYQPS